MDAIKDAPEQATIAVSMKVTPSYKRFLDDYCDRNDSTITRVLVSALRDYFRARGIEPPAASSRR